LTTNFYKQQINKQFVCYYEEISGVVQKVQQKNSWHEKLDNQKFSLPSPKQCHHAVFTAVQFNGNAKDMTKTEP